MGMEHPLKSILIRDDGVVAVPFGFTINGTSTPDGLTGDSLVSVARNEAGEFLLTFLDKPYACFGGEVWASTGDDVDIYGKLAWDLMVSAGTCVARFNTGSTETDPADNTLCGGFLLCKITDRMASR